MDGEQSVTAGWTQIIGAVKTPLSFFVLFVLVSQAIIVALVTKAGASERTIALVGMLVVLLVCAGAVVYLARRVSAGVADSDAPARLQEVLSFDRLIAEISTTMDRLERNGHALARQYGGAGDGQRLLDGLYTGLLFVSGAVPTGRIEPMLYGNMMEWQASNNSLRVRYSKGPYNDEIICRTFPLTGQREGVASEAVNSGSLQYRNEMESELKERGESLLKAMVSIPVYESGAARESTFAPGSIVAINVDSMQAGVFPNPHDPRARALEKRAEEVAALVRRVNELRVDLNS